MNNPLHDIFIQEAEENLEILESRIISIEQNPEDADIINEAFRAIHSIKGGAGLAGFSGIQNFSHELEDLFELVRSGLIKIEENIVSVILRALDILNSMVSNIKQDIDSNDGIETEESIAEIKNLLNQDNKTPANDNDNSTDKKTDISSETDLYYINITLYPEIFSVGIDPLMFIMDLKELGEILYIHTQTEDIPEIQTYNPEHFYLSWQLFFKTNKSKKELIDIFCFVIDESEINFTKLTDILTDSEAVKKFKINDFTILDFEKPAKKTEKSFESPPPFPDEKRAKKDRRQTDRRTQETAAVSYIRVQTDKLENIFNTVSELLILQARLNMLTDEYEESIPDSFGTVTDSLKNITNLIQEQITSLRMMSLNSTFDRFKRVVRDIASDRGKKVQLLIEGQDTELDKNMIEKLNDPLKHLVRNCIDHGIETEEIRKEKGKSPEGVLKLSAGIEGGKVIIEVSDDGSGINKEKILNKAIERGIVSKDNHLASGEILNLIFHPGLSTAEKVTDLSGRGVGMDVVKSSITELHGTISISSEENIGTVFRLHLPLTLAILDGMLINVGVEKYIIPTLAILEIFRPQKEHLKTISGKGEVVLFRGDYIPILRLHNVFQVQDGKENTDEGELIVIMSGGIKAAILVDTVLEQYQVVLKSLQRNFRRIENISSATILGNGDVALIIDIQSLINNSSIKENDV